MTKLSVNVNKIATLRNSRGGHTPDVLQTALDIEKFGAEGITVHPRPDARHIRFDDVFQLKGSILVELNVEGYPSEDFLELIRAVKPAQCTLVPDAPDVLTSNAGWNIIKERQTLEKVLGVLQDLRVRSSLFVDPSTTSKEDLALAAKMGADRIELYTEAYAKAYHTDTQQRVTQDYKRCAVMAQSFGLGINAGHDLNTQNLRFFVEEVPEVLEVSIGHALISDALYWGLEKTVKKYRECLEV